MRRILGDSTRRMMVGISVGFVLLAIGIMGLGYAPTLGIFLFFTAVRTVGTGTLWVFSAVLLQIIVPDRYRGRVFAFEFAALTLTQSISILWAGYGQDSLGLTIDQVSIMFGWLGVIVLGGWGAFYMKYRFQSSEQPVSS